MTKACLITDLHFGARNDNIHFDNFFKKFYENIFFPYLKEQSIRHVFLLGDVFDRRKFINFNILQNCKEYFFNKLAQNNIETHVLVGNHDVYFKNTNHVNSLQILLKEYDNLRIIEHPKEIDFFGRKILMVPWINSENYSDTINLINSTEALTCFGHLEIAGFEMYKGQIIEHGHDRKIFDRFDLVCSGHYHHRSSDGLIYYLGNPYEITWADYDDPRGFHIYDSTNNSLEFIENPYKMFYKIFYDDSLNDMKRIDVENIKGKHVKVIVINKTNYYLFERFMNSIHNSDPLDLKIIEDFEEFQVVDVNEEVDVGDTLSLLNNYVESVDTDKNKQKLKTILKSLYVEALSQNE